MCKSMAVLLLLSTFILVVSPTLQVHAVGSANPSPQLEEINGGFEKDVNGNNLADFWEMN
ncbi:hypothetical protein NQ117_08570 [Paenibacillus sp. SC116]|uniref:hypothetical protein n=1 Tax=Paenibacillus sp. SC116 TaxID=2968986 RepID=UPI00215A9C2A|nr:hypothetical protein [Paenibacillus sp. SC116]MCR8843739.1 hypothetical protein [Paenibacillus sp. SC116]